VDAGKVEFLCGRVFGFVELSVCNIYLLNDDYTRHVIFQDFVVICNTTQYA
jgi:hypothetical protein